jgi:uncharacterized integral membrane protein (TIGR00698 family)
MTTQQPPGAIDMRPGSGQLGWGIALAGGIAALAYGAAAAPGVQRLGLSALTLAILLGILVGNTVFPTIASRVSPGVDFSKNRLLRAGIVLYGWRITFHELIAVGWSGLLIDILLIASTFTIAVQVGTRVFKLDRQTAMLIGTGSAICGAAAIMAAEPVVRGQAHRVSVAVATVVVFGTLGMFVYPALYPHLGLSEQAYGVYAGSTIHEVAQVVAATKPVSDSAAATAVIEKMLRVMMLAPFLVMLSSSQHVARSATARGVAASSGIASAGTAEAPRRFIPWFAILFIVVSAVNSLQILPVSWVKGLTELDTLLLATAMAGLGLRTHLAAVRQAGLRPLLLALTLFAFLTVGGYGINLAVVRLLS